MTDFKKWFVKNVLEQYNKQLNHVKLDANNSPVMTKEEVIDLASEVAKQVIDLSVSIPPLEAEGDDDAKSSLEASERQNSIKDAVRTFCERARDAWDERERKLLAEVDETALSTDTETTFHADPSLITAIASAGRLRVTPNTSVSSTSTNNGTRHTAKGAEYNGNSLITSSEYSTAKGDGLMRAWVGKSASFSITAKDENNQQRTVGGDTFIVEGKDCNIKAVIKDMENGVYSVEYKVPKNLKGTSISISVSLNEKSVNGSPFPVPIVRDFDVSFIRTWGEKGGKKAQFQHPGGISLDTEKKTIFVVDRFNHRVQVFRYDGSFVRMWGSNGAGTSEFRNPAAVVANSDIVCVADTTNHRIQVFRQDGSFRHKWGSRGVGQGQFRNPYGLAITEDSIYVGDCGNHRIQVFDRDGTFLRMWGANGSGEGQLSYPYGLVVDGDYVYVADRNNHRIQVFHKDGTFVRSWGTYGSGEGQFNSPEAITLSDGIVYVTEYGKHRIQVFLRDGSFVQTLGGSSNKVTHGLFTYPTALAMDGDTMFMTEADLNRVQVFKLTTHGLHGGKKSTGKRKNTNPGNTDEETESEEEEEGAEMSKNNAHRLIQNNRPSKIVRHS